MRMRIKPHVSDRRKQLHTVLQSRCYPVAVRSTQPVFDIEDINRAKEAQDLYQEVENHLPARVTKMSGSEGRGEAEGRIQKSRDLLLKAVECLNQLESVGAPSESHNVREASERPGPSRTPSGLSFSEGYGRSFTLSDAAHRERNSLFNFAYGKRKYSKISKPSKKKRVAVWTHDFICLAMTDQQKAPSAFHRSQLITAGLGKKSLSLFEFGDSTDFHTEVIEAFPKLKDAGGYELLHEDGNRGFWAWQTARDYSCPS